MVNELNHMSPIGDSRKGLTSNNLVFDCSLSLDMLPAFAHCLVLIQGCSLWEQVDLPSYC